MGRVYMDQPSDCPFQAADREIAILKQQCDIIIIDLCRSHQRKLALAYYVDGRVSVFLEPISCANSR